MKDIPIFKDGVVICRLRTRPDGQKVMYKSGVLKDKQIMSLTGSPGWDTETVDRLLVNGDTLRYTYHDTEYSIEFTLFKMHAFVREDAGRQYHCHAKFYTASGLVKTKGRLDQQTTLIPEIPEGRLTFGEWAICPKCHARVRKVPCVRCGGAGIVRNEGPIPFLRNPGGE